MFLDLQVLRSELFRIKKKKKEVHTVMYDLSTSHTKTQQCFDLFTGMLGHTAPYAGVTFLTTSCNGAFIYQITSLYELI